MDSFYNVLVRDINRNYTTKIREYYEEVVATWLLKNYLTTDEADKILALLDEKYGPVTEPTV